MLQGFERLFLDQLVDAKLIRVCADEIDNHMSTAFILGEPYLSL